MSGWKVKTVWPCSQRYTHKEELSGSKYSICMVASSGKKELTCDLKLSAGAEIHEASRGLFTCNMISRICLYANKH